MKRTIARLTYAPLGSSTSFTVPVLHDQSPHVQDLFC